MFPPIPLDVLLALEQAFPERCPTRHTTHIECMVVAGQAEVVRLLRRKFDEQNKNILSPEDDAQDVLSGP